jgi:hypothetical protein
MTAQKETFIKCRIASLPNIVSERQKDFNHRPVMFACSYAALRNFRVTKEVINATFTAVPVDLFRNYHHSTPRTERLDILSCVLA